MAPSSAYRRGRRWEAVACQVSTTDHRKMKRDWYAIQIRLSQGREARDVQDPFVSSGEKRKYTNNK